MSIEADTRSLRLRYRYPYRYRYRYRYRYLRKNLVNVYSNTSKYKIKRYISYIIR